MPDSSAHPHADLLQLELDILASELAAAAHRASQQAAPDAETTALERPPGKGKDGSLEA
jgi:hypothetical protein